MQNVNDQITTINSVVKAFGAYLGVENAFSVSSFLVLVQSKALCNQLFQRRNVSGKMSIRNF